MSFKSDYLRILSERGFIHQFSDQLGLDSLLSKETVTAYIGFDATASSLHAGSMTQIMLLYWLGKTGHKPIVLIGGGTSMVGDPSGRDESRQIARRKTIEDNKISLKNAFSSFFYEQKGSPLIVDNAEWLLKLNYVNFLRDVGIHFSVNAMLARESVKIRLNREQHLSFLEFNYMCLQAYDFVELSRRYECRLQMGGSDQWGNIVSGIDLGRRIGTEQLYGLTTPLLTRNSGAKMGKTASGAIWLNSEKLSVFDFWQYWRNIEDKDVGRFLRLFTTLPIHEICKMERLKGIELNEAKKKLATEATRLVHGDEAAQKAEKTACDIFEKRALSLASSDLPSIVIDYEEFNKGIGLLNLLVNSGLARSNGEARRQIKSGAIKVNDIGILDERESINTSFLDKNGSVKISFGKKKHLLIRPE